MIWMGKQWKAFDVINTIMGLLLKYPAQYNQDEAWS
jgi:hypothetical protein